MAVTLGSSSEVQAHLGSLPAVIRVKNLQSSIQGPHDAWGRTGRPQPIAVTAEVFMGKPFGASSAGDVVDADTVHYGFLSKAILAALGGHTPEASAAGLTTLQGVLATIWRDLTAERILLPVDDLFGKAFLDLSVVRCLSIQVKLPKASLLGDGVSLTGTVLFNDAAESSSSNNNNQSGITTSPSSRLGAVTMKLHDLRIPTLIGVNANERLAKQVVIANVEVDKYAMLEDAYVRLEQVVVNTMSTSSFETLEALAAGLALQITEHLKTDHQPQVDGEGWPIRISLEKPVAVPFADASCVELRVNTNDVATSST